jgi:hypothetical protein
MIELFADCDGYMICGCESAHDDLHCATCTEVPARHTSFAIRSFLATWPDDEDRRLVAAASGEAVDAGERPAVR